MVFCSDTVNNSLTAATVAIDNTGFQPDQIAAWPGAFEEQA
jgi:hypothetical protein